MRMAKFNALPEDIKAKYNESAATKTPERYAAE